MVSLKRKKKRGKTMENKKTVLLFLGKARAGKDESFSRLAKYLETKNVKIEHKSFADLLKRQAREICYWDGLKDEAGRRLLQDLSKPIKAYVSTLKDKYPDNEFYQDMAGGAYYPAHTLKEIRESEDKLFGITDCRFQSETNLFNSKDYLNTITIRIIRTNPDGTMYTGGLSPEALADISENDLNDYVTDYVIHNDGTLDDLQVKVEALGDEILAKLEKEGLV